ncbi:hypothetical protein WJX74_000034 [Apatococcus lobatus]|uniref:DUF4239 domain-containing protein n=1 Tax=Apatococcus lobatus TaxID=904363 RepID=A0AAW1SF84_9CHLO
MAAPAQELATVVLSVTLASAAILAVYVVLGQRVERDVVRKQTGDVVRSLLSDSALLGDSGTAALHEFLVSLNPPDSAADDARVETQNAAILHRAFVVVAGFVAAGMAVAAYLSRSRGFGLSGPLREAARSTVLAAGTECAFLLLIARNFVSADPQAVRAMILDELAAQTG